MMVFFGTGVFGIVVGLTLQIFMITFMGVINLCLGGFFGWIFLNQEPRSKHKRKK